MRGRGGHKFFLTVISKCTCLIFSKKIGMKKSRKKFSKNKHIFLNILGSPGRHFAPLGGPWNPQDTFEQHFEP